MSSFKVCCFSLWNYKSKFIRNTIIVVLENYLKGKSCDPTLIPVVLNAMLHVQAYFSPFARVQEALVPLPLHTFQAPERQIATRNHGEVTPLSSRTPRARQKKSIFSKLHHKMNQLFINFFSWVDIHNIYYILKFHNQIRRSVVFNKHTISN